MPALALGLGHWQHCRGLRQESGYGWQDAALV
jgi:hypothetical protein